MFDWVLNAKRHSQNITVNDCCKALSLSPSFSLPLSLRWLKRFFFCRCQLEHRKFVKNLEIFQALYKSFYIILYKSYYLVLINWKSWTIHKKRKDTVMRKSTNVHKRLSVTLRLLPTGHSFVDLEADCKIHWTTISGIVAEVCNAVYDILKNKYLKKPPTKED